MASFQVRYPDGSLAKRKKVTISVNRGGMAYGMTDDKGYVSIRTSTDQGKIIVNGRTVHKGSLDVDEVMILKNRSV